MFVVISQRELSIRRQIIRETVGRLFRPGTIARRELTTVLLSCAGAANQTGADGAARVPQGREHETVQGPEGQQHGQQRHGHVAHHA